MPYPMIPAHVSAAAPQPHFPAFPLSQPPPPPPPSSSSSAAFQRGNSTRSTSGGTSHAFNSVPPPNTSTPNAAASTSAATTTNATTTGSSPFKAPAHKHAHHLHSIPPREKSTRTLIIDHMLWVHARTRFAQARAELGMTDRTGGPAAPAYRSRERPETYDEEDEAMSDGEPVASLRAREGGPDHPYNEDEATRREKQDLALARSLRLRAEGLEKVVHSMLDQPPPIIHPIMDDERATSPPSSPKLAATGGVSPKRTGNATSQSQSHPHTLPNGVRLRLALGTVVNDLFARQAPPPPYRHHHHSTPIHINATTSEGPTPGNSPIMQKIGTPGSYRSPSASGLAGTPGAGDGSRGVGSGGGGGTRMSIDVLPPSLQVLAVISAGPAIPLLPNPELNSPGRGGIQPFPSMGASTSTVPAPSARVRALYEDGADPSTANSPPAFRCPRHLHQGCEICVEAKQPVRAPGGSGRLRGLSLSYGTDASGRSRSTALGGYGTGSSIVGGVGMGGSGLGVGAGDAPPGGGITGWQDGSGIGSGLARPGVHGSVLRRKSKWPAGEVEGEAGAPPGVAGGSGGSGSGVAAGPGTGNVGDGSRQGGTGAGNTRITELIPRFIRLSALVAMELGEELKYGEYTAESSGWTTNASSSSSSTSGASTAAGGQYPVTPTPAYAALPGATGRRNRSQSVSQYAQSNPSASQMQNQNQSQSQHQNATQNQNQNQNAAQQADEPAAPLRPSREWYALFAGLLTRAALEGYLTGGWRGFAPVECLLSVGLGMGGEETSASTGAGTSPASSGAYMPSGFGQGWFPDGLPAHFRPAGGRSAGLGAEESSGTERGEDDEDGQSGSDNSEEGEADRAFEWFDPDELPSLKAATRIMFPSLQMQHSGQGSGGAVREGAEREFAEEMGERLRRFYAIPQRTPDLSTHMEDLAWHYPAEPVERAALRFCEAIAKWRGKPELETYKKRQKDIPAGITIDSLVHSNPTSPTSTAFPPSSATSIAAAAEAAQRQRERERPPIEKYFTLPPAPASERESARKRRRSTDEGDRYDGGRGVRTGQAMR